MTYSCLRYLYRVATGLAGKNYLTFPWLPTQIQVTLTIYTLWWFLQYIQNCMDIALFFNIVVLKIGQHKITFSTSWKLSISYMLSREYRVARNRYSRLLFTSEDRFAPICVCSNDQRIWGHNAGAVRSCDVTDQLWWRHNTKSEKAVLSDNGEITNR